MTITPAMADAITFFFYCAGAACLMWAFWRFAHIGDDA